MDKLKFNNLVISNKKLIQKARAQTIAKLVQKLRKAKDGLAKNPDSEKEKIRLRKNSECLAQLKALKCLDILRQCLLQEGTNPNTVIASERSTPDELGIAMLRLNKIMHGLVDTFVEALKLSTDKEAKWREEILETSKRRSKIERTEEKKRKRQELKDQKAQTRNRLEWLEQNKVAGAVGTEGEAKEAIEGSGQVETEQESQPEQAKDSKKDEKHTPATKPEKPQPQKKNRNERKPLKKPAKPQPLPKKESISESQENKQNPPEKKTLREVKPKELKQKPVEVRERKSKSRPERQLSIEEEPKPDKDRPTHVVDPFFITESGQPYLSTAVVHSDDNESEAEEEQRPPPVKRFRGQDDRRDNNHRERPERRQEFGTKKPHDDRHPSWVAKQQQKPIIGDFRGKKITFSEDGQAAEVRVPRSNPSPAAGAPESTEGMHPSWVAKQKWKPKIAEFQGTKIKFDED